MSEIPAIESDADPTYTHFTHRDEFNTLLNEFLHLSKLDEEHVDEQDEAREIKLVNQMGGILDHYLPLPPLLDPYLHDIIPPLMEKLSSHFQAIWQVAEQQSNPRNDEQEGFAIHISSNTARLARVGRLVNWVIKVRGRKGAVTHFPPNISNLPVLVYLLSPSTSHTSSPDVVEGFPCHPALSAPRSWEIRSVCFLWLSLLLTVPFDLAAFDNAQSSSSTSTGSDETTITARVLAIGKGTLFVPSKEGEYSALVLARLFARSDGVDEMDGFFEWVDQQLQSDDVTVATDRGTEGSNSQGAGDDAVFLTHVLALLALLPSLLPNARTVLPRLMAFYTKTLEPRVENMAQSTSSGSTLVSSNGLLRKMAVKARGRWWVAMLGVTMGEAGKVRRIARGRHVVPLKGQGNPNDTVNVLQSFDYAPKLLETEIEEEEEEFDPPDGLEEEIDRLMGSLSDKDTIVRYSSAKYLSRLADLLPLSLSLQIVESTISLFGGTPEDPLVETDRGKIVDPGGGSNGEAKWHGLCLALAEMGRRGLIENDMVKDLLSWAVKALNFDIRRGAHSIGSNVRDAAAYLVWSLARALSPTTIRPFTQVIAQTLVCVACFDREVGIRRAASAAFQEHVGRMGMFPHGIDVLRKTDFYSVSVRRSAFLTAAPQVAVHSEYRSAMLEHLHYTTLRHWDPAMRLLGSQSLRTICDLEGSLPEQALRIELDQLASVELPNIHGGLAALNELASIYRARRDNQHLSEIFGSLRTIRPSAFSIPGSDLLLEAACNVITNTACEQVFKETLNTDVWARILELAMKNRKEEVQMAAAVAFGAISHHRDWSKSGRPLQKQSFAMALGQADYTRTPALVHPVLRCLLGNVSITTKAPQQDVETRRASYHSILAIIQQSESSAVPLPNEDFSLCFKSFVDGLEDYSTDQRGDVGSWIRITCAQSLPSIIRMGRRVEGRLDTAACLDAVRGLLELSIEKLETVRVAAGPAACQVLDGCAGELGLGDCYEHLRTIDDWKDVRTLYSKVAEFLNVKSIQRPVFEGLVLSLGGKNLATHNAAANAITRALQSPSADPDLVNQLTRNLLVFGTENLNKQRIFTPVLMTAFELAQAEVWNRLNLASECAQDLIKLVNLAARGLTIIKNIERLTSSMKFIIACLTIPVAQKTALRHVPNLINHAFPRIRTLTAEQVYLTLQTAGIEDPALDELLLNVDWAENDYSDAAKELVKLLGTVL